MSEEPQGWQRRVMLLFRFVRIAAVLVWGALRTWWRIAQAERPPREDKERIAGDEVARALETLGATFVKFGQILSTRPDLLPPTLIEPLSRLQDRVPAASFNAMDGVLQAEWSPAQWDQVVSIDPEPVAAASVAQVHRGVLVDGMSVAIKVQRPNAREDIERDLVLLHIVARVVDAIPSVHMLSLPGAAQSFAEALHRQLDFRCEADNNLRFRANFKEVPDVSFPELVPALCTERVLVMEFIEGVRATEPEKVGGDRAKLAAAGMDAVLRMIFSHGFVHADLHPGNILITHDERIVMIDLGLVAEIAPRLMRPYVETFLALAQQNGARAAELFYTHAPEVRTRDYRAFERDVVRHFKSLEGKTLGEVETSESLAELMAILRRHRVKMDPSFTVVHVAMIVAEGLGKQLDPNIDPIQLSVPHLMKSLATAPKGVLPKRELPKAA